MLMSIEVLQLWEKNFEHKVIISTANRYLMNQPTEMLLFKHQHFHILSRRIYNTYILDGIYEYHGITCMFSSG